MVRVRSLPRVFRKEDAPARTDPAQPGRIVMSVTDTDILEESDAAERKTSVTFQKVFAYAWSYWRRYPVAVAVLVFGQFATTGAYIIQPYLAGKLVDAVALDEGSLDLATVLLGLFLAAITFNIVMRQVHERYWIYLATSCMARIAQDAFFRVQRFSTQWHANNFAGATVRKVTRGMWGFDLFGDTLSYGFIPTVLMIVWAIVILSLQIPILGVLMVIAVSLYGAIVYLMSTRYVGPTNRVFVAQDSRLGAVMADAVTCNATVKSFGAEGREDDLMEATTTDWREKASRTWNRSVLTGLVQSVILLILQGSLISVALWYWSRGMATPGQITMVITIYLVLNGYLRDMGMHMRNMQQAMNDIEDIVLFQDKALGVEDMPGAMKLMAGHGRIVFDRVRFAYDNQPDPVYDDFSIEIASGERVALVGQSGSGKSTFVKLVQRLYDVDGGEIRIDGQDVARVSQESLRQAIALVPQEPILFHRTLAENIAYARPGATRSEIARAARQAHAHEFIARLPKGYDTLVGERGVKLSGGERQRVALARAFLADAPILILDEATSSLDSVTEELIQEAMDELMEGRTTIVIAHRLSTIQSVDRILVFADGRIVEQGTHTELMARPDGHYRKLYQTQYGGCGAREAS